jgi:hypothetical protein
MTEDGDAPTGAQNIFMSSLHLPAQDPLSLPMTSVGDVRSVHRRWRGSRSACMATRGPISTVECESSTQAAWRQSSGQIGSPVREDPPRHTLFEPIHQLVLKHSRRGNFSLPQVTQQRDMSFSPEGDDFAHVGVVARIQERLSLRQSSFDSKALKMVTLVSGATKPPSKVSLEVYPGSQHRQSAEVLSDECMCL